MAVTKKAAKPYSAMNKAELVRALTQRDRTIAKLEKRIETLEGASTAINHELRGARTGRVTVVLCDDCPTPRVCGSEGKCLGDFAKSRTTLPRNPMPWECS